jgi:hypothetical protein
MLMLLLFGCDKQPMSMTFHLREFYSFFSHLNRISSSLHFKVHQFLFISSRVNVVDRKLERFAQEQSEQNRKLMEMMSKQNEIIERLLENAKPEKGKGKGRGKKSDASASSGILGTIRSTFSGSKPIEEDNMSTSSSSSFVRIPEDQSTSSLPPPQQQPEVRINLGATKTVFVTKCELQLNGQPVDQLESKQAKDQCMNDYNRLYLTCGLANSLQSNYISYPAFMGGCFVSAWDLSTSGFVGNSYALPNIKTGRYKFGTIKCYHLLCYLSNYI